MEFERGRDTGRADSGSVGRCGSHKSNTADTGREARSRWTGRRVVQIIGGGRGRGAVVVVRRLSRQTHRQTDSADDDELTDGRRALGSERVMATDHAPAVSR